MPSELFTEEELGCNARITVYENGETDDARAYSRNIFLADGWEKKKRDIIALLPEETYIAACHGHIPYQLISHKIEMKKADCSASEIARRNAESLKRSRRRAIEAIYEYIRNNDEMDCFCTLTLAADREDVDKLAKHLKEFLGKSVQRDNLHYIGVYEYHHDARALHVHLLCNQSALALVRATNAHTGKALSHKDKRGHWHAIYNISNWKFGFSTAMKVYGNRIAIAKYVTKYVTKSERKIRGRWYIHSHNIDRPEHRYYQVCYRDVIGKIVEAPAQAHLHIKYTSPEQIALHIDKERDIHEKRKRDCSNFYQKFRESIENNIAAANGEKNEKMAESPRSGGNERKLFAVGSAQFA